jgi:hypothetical protein
MPEEGNVRRCQMTATAAAPRVAGRWVASGLKGDVFERLAAREAVEIAGDHTPAPVGGPFGAARTVRRNQLMEQIPIVRLNTSPCPEPPSKVGSLGAYW